jgi:tetratricopeptide (TPR) repeat protein
MVTQLLHKLKTANVLYIATLLFVLTFAFYSNTLFNGLFYDDEQFIYANPTVQSFDLPGFFNHSLTSGAGKLSNYYRPLLFLGFGIEYQLFGNTGFIYHFDSIIVHIASGIVLFLLLKKLFGNQLVALLTSLLFLIHPLQTEAIAYASGRGDPLSFFFVMLALYLSLQKNTAAKIIAPVSFVFALLSKEIAITTPALIILVHIFAQHKVSKQTIWKSLLASLPFWLIAGIYFLLRVSVLNFANTLNFYNSANIYSSHLFVRLNTFFDLLPKYIALLFFPKTLYIERDVNVTIFPQPTLASVLSFFSCCLLFAYGLFAYIKKEHKVFLFGFLWFAFTFVPTSGIIPINGIFYEHFLYYPSVGFFLIISYSLYLLYQKIPTLAKNMLFLLICCVVVALGVRTFARNSEWHDPITFYNQTLAHAQSARVYNNLAMAYADEHEDKKAIPMYQKAISLSDAYPETHFNLGNSYASLGQLNEAEKEYKKSLSLDPTFYRSYISLYRLYSLQHDEKGLADIASQLQTLGGKYPFFVTLLKQLQQSSQQ